MIYQLPLKIDFFTEILLHLKVLLIALLTSMKASKSSSVRVTPENARLSNGHNLKTYPVVSTSTISRGI